MFETVLHFLCCLSLTFDGGVLFLELAHFPPQFLAGGLSIVVKNLGLGYLGCELVEDLLILH